MPDELSTLLDAYNSGSLTAIAGYHGLVNKGAQTKAQSVASLSRALAEPARIARTWQDLSPAERALVEDLQRHDGRARPRLLHRSLASAGLVDAPSPTLDRREANARAVNSRRFADVLARLNLRGLVFECEDAPPPAGYAPNATPPKRDFRRITGQVCLPAAILAHLPPPPPATTGAEPLQVEHIRPASARTFQRDLYLYWSFVRETPFRLTLKGQPPKPVLKNLAAQLLERAETGGSPDETSQPRLRFMRQLLQWLGLLATSPERDLRVTGRADFFSLAPLERVQRSFEVWRSSGWFFEFGLLPAGVRPSDPELDSAPEANSALTQARTTVLKQLAGQFDGGWQSLPALIDEIRDQDYQFLVPRPPAQQQQLYYRGPYDAMLNPYGLAFGSLYGDADSHWDQVEASFIRAVVTGPLHWLGLADTGMLPDTPGPASAFRLTEMGRWVLGLGPPPALQAEGGRVIAQPNLHIVALDPVADATLVQLDQFAERLSAERAVEYRLTRASVYAGQQAGWDVARIKAFLRAQTRAELPGNVERTLDEWQTQHERIILRTGVSLAHGPADLFDALLADPRSQPLAAGRPTPEVVILGAPVAGFVEAAARLGLLPLLNQPEEPGGDSVEADDAGRVRLLAARPNLYLHGRLAAFADPAGEGLYQLSAESVARAGRGGLAAPAIIQQLQRLHRGPLPAGLPQRIKAWAHHYGDGALEEVVLLQLNNPAILAELMAEPDMADLLKPFTPTPARPLARLRRQDLETLRARLAARGINLKDKLA
ncbi:MAG: helicase-associated domain-containing protein [Anaerolineales bacterium]